jgi:hypothetical protein
MYVLLEDDSGRLVLRRLRCWHRMLAHVLAARFDRQLASGVQPEASPSLAARAEQLTSSGFRAGLAASVRGLLAEAGDGRGPAGRRPGDRPSHGIRSAGELAQLTGTEPADPGLTGTGLTGPGQGGSGRISSSHPQLAPAHSPHPCLSRPRVPVCRARIRRSAPQLAELASQLTAPGPVPARGVAMVGMLLTDGLGPLYRPGCREDLGAAVVRATAALAR